jgi:hypothetical protein
MSDEILIEISKKLNALIALSLRQLAEDKEFGRKSRTSGLGDQVRFFAEFGLDSKDIAEITGAPLPSVRTLMTPSRRT